MPTTDDKKVTKTDDEKSVDFKEGWEAGHKAAQEDKLSISTRHHIEFQSTDNRYAEVQRTTDYEEFITRYEHEEDRPTLEKWTEEMVKLYGYASGGPGRVRIWLITREELEVVV